MDSTKSPYGKAGDSEEGSETERGFGARRSAVRAHNPQQTVVAHTITNNGNIEFASQDRNGSLGQEGTYQSINAENVRVSGGIAYNNQHFYIGNRDRWTISKWLANSSPLTFDKKHRNTIEIFRKTPGTGQWLLKDPSFQAWREGGIHRLLCSGIPGAGKTVLASIIIDHLQTYFKLGNAVCIYIYFDYKDQEKYIVQNLYFSLLAQLVQYRTHFSKEVEEAFENWEARKVFPTTGEYLEMLEAEIKSFARVNIVIDALDECPSDTHNNTRAEFLKTIRHLPSNVYTIFTSRPDLDIHSEVKADAELVITAQDEDLRSYLNSRVSDPAQGRLQALIKQGDDQFWEKALNMIISKSKGMFLLAQLHMDFLASKFTLQDFNEGLKTLPKSPDGVYELAFERITKQGEFKYRLAIRSLGWLVFAERSLTISELLHAVAIELENKKLSELKVVTEELLTSVCAGILVIDPGTKIVRLAHYTAARYLEKNKASLFDKDFHSSMARACLTYLLFDDFGSQQTTSPSSSRPKKKNTFHNYAANHWGDHISFGAHGDVHRLACKLLSDDAKLTNAFRAMTETRFAVEENVTGLHIAAYFGIAKFARKLCKRRMYAINAQTANGETAVHWATFYKQTKVLDLLIQEGADVNVADKAGRTALHRAVVNEDTSAVELILSSKNVVDLNMQDAHRWTPLRYAAAYGLSGLVDLLLTHKAKIDAADEDGWTALRWAAQRGHKEIVETLIHNGASLESPKSSKDGWTLLSWAAREGRTALIELLIERHVLDDATPAERGTALCGAIEYGHGKVVYLLLRAQASVNLPDPKGRTPLHIAVEVWEKASDKTLPWLLLESGAHVNTKTRLGQTALHLAALKGYNTLIWLLLEKGADPKRKDNTGQTALHSAVTGQQEETIRLLIQKCPDLVNARDNERRTALHDAASSDQLSIVRLLLNSKSNVNAADRQGCTALHRAVIQGHRNVVLCLISNGADLGIRNKRKKTALEEARLAGNENIIDLFKQSKTPKNESCS